MAHISQTRVFVQSQGILTQLIFDHALRIRVKSETEDQVPAEGDKSALVTPPSGASSSTSEPPSSTASAKGKSPAKSTTPSESKAEKKLDPKGKNLTGKINNLVTSDLNMLQVGQLFLLLSMGSNISYIGEV